MVNSHSYFGVTASSDLRWRWHEHVNNVSAQATKTRNFIRRNVYCCPPDAKATAYISLVRPHLEYAAAVWEVQRRAVRFVKQINNIGVFSHFSTWPANPKPSLIVGETVAYHSCTRVFTVWLVFPPHLFVVLVVSR